MKTTSRHFSPFLRTDVAVGILSLLLVTWSAQAQLSVFKNTTSDRIEAATILGGDFGLNAATFQGDNGTSVDLQKFGGMGDVGDPKQLWSLPIGWQPQLQGSMSYLTSTRDFNSGPLIHSQSKIHDYFIQFGGGARLWFSDSFSIAPTIMGMYGQTKNDFYAQYNPFANANHLAARQAGLVDYSVDTWTVRPALNLQYVYTWHRAICTLSSDPTLFHTESFNSSNPNVSVNGDSETWMNKIDIDIPLAKNLFGHELRTGGYISRTDIFGDMKNGIGKNCLYEAHGRLVLDYLNQLWKVQWIGIGASYLWGDGFTGYSYGLDIAFRF